MKLNPNFFCCILLFACNAASAQFQKYAYKRPITGISNQWHEIGIPETAFGKMAGDFSDLRIYGTNEKDTIEAPYILRAEAGKVTDQTVAFQIINTARNRNGFYYTFEIPQRATINQITLHFSQQNFDWKVRLEGSQDQKEWFTVADSSRILSIQNNLVHFEYSKINFAGSNYRYYRLLVPGKDDPGFISAEIVKHLEKNGKYHHFPVDKLTTAQDKTNRQTIIMAELKLAVPISYVKVNVANTYDYYRPISIEYVTDSVNTAKGWKYNYQTLASGTLNSLQQNVFKCSSTLLQKLKITIDNGDNQPLAISSLEIKGYEHKILARFTERADYFLVYGNKEANAPQYDIVQFADKIPQSLIALPLGAEQKISENTMAVARPLFENKTWLWLLMIAIILILGAFSLSMIRKS